MALTNDFVYNRLKETFGDAIYNQEIAFDFMNVEIDPAFNQKILAFLKNDEELNFSYLTDLCGVHMPEQSGRELGVIYHLHNLENNYRFRLKAWVPENNPQIATASKVWLGANWMERETYDFYGINFMGHPQLKRILNMDEMVSFPMRKEFPMEDNGRTDKDDRFFGRTANC
jgi:NADH-quinone oxidoreductase subunit C